MIRRISFCEDEGRLVAKTAKQENQLVVASGAAKAKASATGSVGKLQCGFCKVTPKVAWFRSIAVECPAGFYVGQVQGWHQHPALPLLLQVQ